MAADNYTAKTSIQRPGQQKERKQLRLPLALQLQPTKLFYAGKATSNSGWHKDDAYVVCNSSQRCTRSQHLQPPPTLAMRGTTMHGCAGATMHRPGQSSWHLRGSPSQLSSASPASPAWQPSSSNARCRAGMRDGFEFGMTHNSHTWVVMTDLRPLCYGTQSFDSPAIPKRMDNSKGEIIGPLVNDAENRKGRE